MWKKGKNRLLMLVYNNSSFHTFEIKNVENVESGLYQHFFTFKNVEEMCNKYNDRKRFLG